MESLSRQILKALQSVLPKDTSFITLHEPCMKGNEWDYVKECLDTGWISSAGKFVDQFESMLSQYTGAKFAIAVVNGTAALHMCLLLADVQSGDEVIIPALTFVATANAVSYCGAIPNFSDSDERTLGICPHKLRNYLKEIAIKKQNGCFNKQSGRRIRAIVPVHIFGHPVDIDPIKEICDEYAIVLIEDAAESLGSFYKGRHTGNTGLVSAISFNGNKTISTGGGGAILTNDEHLAKRAKHLTTTAKLPHKWEYNHDQIGYNYRLPNLNAALGVAQLEQLPGFLESKRNLANRFENAFNQVDGVRFFKEPDFARSNYWLNCILLKQQDKEQFNAILELCNNNGFMTRPAWTLLNELPMYKSCSQMHLTNAKSIVKRLINIPSSAYL